MVEKRHLAALRLSEANQVAVGAAGGAAAAGILKIVDKLRGPGPGGHDGGAKTRPPAEGRSRYGRAAR